MLSKTLGKAFIRRTHARNMNNIWLGSTRIAGASIYRVELRYFSAEGETPKEEEAGKVPEPTAEEIEKGRSDWGIKYDDECLKFEKEWNIIAKAVEE